MNNDTLTDDGAFKSGHIAIVGRPNVGKSTLLNRILGQKISITTYKPQTTRHRILGIHSTTHYQMVFVDTPGFHLGVKKRINRYMNKVALGALDGVDIILLVVQAGHWTDEEQQLLKHIKRQAVPVIVAINKIDVIRDKAILLPFLDSLSDRFNFTALVPLSAKRGTGLNELESELFKHLPIAPPYYEEDRVTDQSVRFMAAEIVREKLYLALHDEIPYGLTVEIETYKEQPNMDRISAIIWVEKASHKPIIIGQKGTGLKAIGQAARQAMEKSFDKKIFLELWVKVKTGWTDDQRALISLGYKNDIQ